MNNNNDKIDHNKLLVTRLGCGILKKHMGTRTPILVLVPISNAGVWFSMH